MLLFYLCSTFMIFGRCLLGPVLNGNQTLTGAGQEGGGWWQFCAASLGLMWQAVIYSGLDALSVFALTPQNSQQALFSLVAPWYALLGRLGRHRLRR